MRSEIDVNASSLRGLPVWIERLLAHGGYPLLFVCAGLMDLRRVIAVAVARSHDEGISRIFDEVNFLVFAPAILNPLPPRISQRSVFRFREGVWSLSGSS